MPDTHFAEIIDCAANKKLVDTISKEAKEFELVSTIAMLGHFNGCEEWEKWDRVLGIATAVFGALSVGTIASTLQVNANGFPSWLKMAIGVGAIFAAVITACVKFLNPAKQTSDHGRAGKQYQALAEDLRSFYRVDLVTNIRKHSTDSLLGALNTFKRRRQEIHESAPIIPADAWRKTIEKSDKQTISGLKDVHARRIMDLMEDLEYSLEEGRLPRQPVT